MRTLSDRRRAMTKPTTRKNAAARTAERSATPGSIPLATYGSVVVTTASRAATAAARIPTSQAARMIDEAGTIAMAGPSNPYASENTRAYATWIAGATAQSMLCRFMSITREGYRPEGSRKERYTYGPALRHRTDAPPLQM